MGRKRKVKRFNKTTQNDVQKNEPVKKGELEQKVPVSLRRLMAAQEKTKQLTQQKGKKESKGTKPFSSFPQSKPTHSHTITEKKKEKDLDKIKVPTVVCFMWPNCVADHDIGVSLQRCYRVKAIASSHNDSNEKHIKNSSRL
jgi:hypothetical protein